MKVHFAADCILLFVVGAFGNCNQEGTDLRLISTLSFPFMFKLVLSKIPRIPNTSIILNPLLLKLFIFPKACARNIRKHKLKLRPLLMWAATRGSHLLWEWVGDPALKVEHLPSASHLIQFLGPL